MDASNQIAIPDLDDDDHLFGNLPQPSFAAAAGGSGSDAGRGSFDDLPGPSRPWLTHGRSGSGTSGDSAIDGNGAETSSMAQNRSQGGPGAWSFPRKGSFASLKAAIKGQQSASQQQPIPPPPPADPSSSTANAFRNFSRTTSGNSRAIPETPMKRTLAHKRSDSQLSFGGKNNYAASIPSRGHHPQQSSHYSEYSAGAASSNNSHSNGQPPLPPFPEHYTNPAMPGGSYTTPPNEERTLGESRSEAQLRKYYAATPTGGPMQSVEPSYFDPNGPVHWAGQVDGLSRLPAAAGSQRGPLTGQPGQSRLGSLPMGIGSPDPKMPSEYALNVLMSRFLERTRLKVLAILDHGLEAEPQLENLFGSHADQDFETLLASLAHVSRGNARLVIESLFSWQALHIDSPVDAETVRRAMAESVQSHASQPIPTGGVKDVAAILTRRKFLVCSYILSRALIEVAKQLPPGTMNESSLNSLLSNIFDLLQSCSRSRLPASTMQNAASDGVSRLLGELSKKYFVPIGDRFISMLEHCSKLPASKTVEVAQETAVQGMRHLVITVFPMELFEEGAEFLEAIARFFSSAHGPKIKETYAETLTYLILPVAKSASAEINHPTWKRAMEMIAPRAYGMLAKPRYWPIAYPLYVATLCGSSEEQFMGGLGGHWGWGPCLESAIPKIKDRFLKPIVLNTALRLIWVYMNRCKESSNTTTKKLETFYRQWFPPGRSTVTGAEALTLTPYVQMVHLVLYRHFDFGRDLVLDLLRHKALSGSTLALQQPEVLNHQRMIIAIRAVLLALDNYVKGESPPFPSSPNFTRFERSDFEGTGNELADDFKYPRPEIADAQAKFNDLIGKIALICDHQVGHTTVFDESVMILRGYGPNQVAPMIDHERYFVRAHPQSRLTVAYPSEQQYSIDLLSACLQAWPRCLSSNLPFSSVLTTLFRAHFSADYYLGDIATLTLKRFARQRKNGAATVVSSFGRFIFRAGTLFWETHPHQLSLLFKVEAAIRVWIDFLNIWLAKLRDTKDGEQGIKSQMERTSAWAINDEVEAYGLLLLCSGYRPLRRQAISVLRLVSILDDAFSAPKASSVNGEAEPSRIIHLLDMPCREFCNVEDSQLTAEQRQKVQEWTRTDSLLPLSDLAESDYSIEHSLWQHVLPRFLRMCLDHFPTTVAVFRAHVTNRVLNMDAAVAIAAGLVPRQATMQATTRTMPASSSAVSLNPSGQASAAEQALMAEHWKFYILALCTTTTSTEGSRGAALTTAAHRRQASDAGSSERTIGARDLFQKLVPFLASESPRFCEAVVTALGNINVNLYRTLLETLQAVSSQLNDGGRSRSLGRSTAPARRHVRLRTALAHVVQLTSSHMSGAKTFSDAAIMPLVLNWVRDTFNFLMDREIKADWDFQSLRRFFCGVVEDLYKGLSSSKEREKHFPFDTRLRMFKLYSDWYSFSQSAKDGPSKLASLLASVAELHRDDKNREQLIMALRNDTQALSFHASNVMATLCQGSITAKETSTQATVFEPRSLVSWLQGLFRSSAPIDHAIARRALRSLLLTNGDNEDLVAACIDAAFDEPDPAIGTRSLFSCLCTAIVSAEPDQIKVPQHHTFCLALTKLGHPDAELRRKAFSLIDFAARKAQPSLSLHDVEVGVSSPLPATYLRSQRDISAYLSNHFSCLKVAMVCEYTLRLQSIDALRRSTTLGLLPDWLKDIDLLQGAESAGGDAELPYCSLLVLCNLLFLTIRHGDEHNFEIQDAWASLAEGSQILFNANAIVKFLVEQGLCYRSPSFTVHAKRVVSCLSHTVIGPHMFDELCALIRPNSMIPVPREELTVQAATAAQRHLFKANIDALLPSPSSRQVFAPGQLALLFIGELTYERTERLSSKLSLLLHAIFVQLDSFIPFVQEQCLATFEQLMRSLASMSAAVVGSEGASIAKSQVEQLFSRGSANLWSHSDLEVTLDEMKTPKNMRSLLSETLRILQPLSPDLADQWGGIALYWATSGPVRHIACRSFQAFRILLPDATPTMLADMLGRLSNTVSDPDLDIQTFALEILYTLTALVKSKDGGKRDLFAPTFWAALACLNTINEREYAVAIEMVDALLDKLDIGNIDVVRLLQSRCPDGWEGDVGGLQALVLRGLRSSVTSAASFKVLMRLAKVQNPALIDVEEDRLAFLFVSAVPWFLQASTPAAQIQDETLSDLATDIATLAEAQGRADLARVAASIAKSRFRTKDDLLRQAVNCIRSNFLPRLGPQLAVSLLGLTLNQNEWLRNQSMQLLKIFFQVVDTRSREFTSLGSELLMPLLRLLSTPLAAQALGVLDEPIVIHGGPAANQILRMSLQWGKPSRRREQGSDASIFGAPDDSGWAVANPQEFTSKARINIQAVFKACEMTLDVAPVSIVDFVNEDYYDSGTPFMGQLAGGGAGRGEPVPGLNDIVSQLQDLSVFFAADDGAEGRSRHRQNYSEDVQAPPSLLPEAPSLASSTTTKVDDHPGSSSYDEINKQRFQVQRTHVADDSAIIDSEDEESQSSPMTLHHRPSPRYATNGTPSTAKAIGELMTPPKEEQVEEDDAFDLDFEQATQGRAGTGGEWEDAGSTTYVPGQTTAAGGAEITSTDWASPGGYAMTSSSSMAGIGARGGRGIAVTGGGDVTTTVPRGTGNRRSFFYRKNTGGGGGSRGTATGEGSYVDSNGA